MNCNLSVTFIKSLNQSSIKPCLIVHLVALGTLIYFKIFFPPNIWLCSLFGVEVRARIQPTPKYIQTTF